MCLWVILLSLCGVYPFIPLLSENDLCFKLDILVSEEGALHNRQIWPEAQRAAKLSVLSPQITLMWNNLVFCLWCFPPFSLCCTPHLLSFILSWNDLQMYCIFLLYYTVYFLCFNLAVLCLVVCTYLVVSYLTLFVTILSAASQYFGPQSARLAVWRVSGGSLSWSDPFTITLIFADVLFSTPILSHM